MPEEDRGCDLRREEGAGEGIVDGHVALPAVDAKRHGGEDNGAELYHFKATVTFISGAPP